MMQRARSVGSRGFTLVELLTVVVIIGILATLASALVGRHIKAARTSEARSMVQSIRVAQDSYRAENRRYLSVSNSLTDYYPSTPTDGRRRTFYSGGSDDATKKWNILHPTVTGPVMFGYAVVAGDPGNTPPTPNIIGAPTFSVATEPYYVIQAAADMDGNSVQCIVAATSFSPEVFVENEGE
jgi:type IV pilus assembly protein PilA